MGKMMSYAILSVFIIEVALSFVGANVTFTSLYGALMSPTSVYWNIFIAVLLIVVGTTAVLAVITPGFIYQVNQWALFAGVVAVTITFAVVLVDLWVYIQAEILDFSPDFAGLIATFVVAPIAIVYLFAGLEWTRFNQ